MTEVVDFVSSFSAVGVVNVGRLVPVELFVVGANVVIATVVFVSLVVVGVAEELVIVLVVPVDFSVDVVSSVAVVVPRYTVVVSLFIAVVGVANVVELVAVESDVNDAVVVIATVAVASLVVVDIAELLMVLIVTIAFSADVESSVAIVLSVVFPKNIVVFSLFTTAVGVGNMVKLVLVELLVICVSGVIAIVVAALAVAVDVEGELVIVSVFPVAVCLKNVRSTVVVVVSVVVAGVFVSASIRTAVGAVNVVVLIAVEFVVGGAAAVIRRVVVASVAFVDVEAELVIVSVVPVVACVDGVRGVAVIV